MYTVVIGEAKNNPHVAELFYRAGPQQSVQTVAGIIAKVKPELSQLQAMSVATDFFNLIKADFHMRSMLRLPFKLSCEQQQSICRRVCQQIAVLLEACQDFPTVGPHAH